MRFWVQKLVDALSLGGSFRGLLKDDMLRCSALINTGLLLITRYSPMRGGPLYADSPLRPDAPTPLCPTLRLTLCQPKTPQYLSNHRVALARFQARLRLKIPPPKTAQGLSTPGLVNRFSRGVPSSKIFQNHILCL